MATANTPSSTPRRIAGFALLTVLIAIAGLALWSFAMLSWSYANGERAGYVQKFSRKGWLCKTWEGELSLVAVPGSTPEKFLFSVRDDKVAEQINAAMGKRVALSYAQHKGLPSSCFGETEYFVDGVHAVE